MTNISCATICDHFWLLWLHYAFHSLRFWRILTFIQKKSFNRWICIFDPIGQYAVNIYLNSLLSLQNTENSSARPPVLSSTLNCPWIVFHLLLANQKLGFGHLQDFIDLKFLNIGFLNSVTESRNILIEFKGNWVIFQLHPFSNILSSFTLTINIRYV